jgi:hypothetical protein
MNDTNEVVTADIVPGFQIVQIPADSLEGICYTMNAAEVDCQAALHEIVAVLGKYQNTLKQIDTVLASYGVN